MTRAVIYAPLLYGKMTIRENLEALYECTHRAWMNLCAREKAGDRVMSERICARDKLTWLTYLMQKPNQKSLKLSQFQLRCDYLFRMEDDMREMRKSDPERAERLSGLYSVLTAKLLDEAKFDPQDPEDREYFAKLEVYLEQAGLDSKTIPGIRKLYKKMKR